ncbi:peptidoglycan-binding protein [Maricaulis sp. W15]|uniref:peptidoglycan-binding protein n=1 Tax=Maricaulis sp. W15 TaxID=1772333 RepID=UPI000948EA5F|nr:peptidoglycan-binding protein [Maricaulis sp. W15]OLF73953.1 peptidoglycan-binding protein [Maricaulis sp. W15]
MLTVTSDTLRAIAPRFSGDKAARQDEILTRINDELATTLERYAINTALRIAHFLAQTAHESAGFRTTEEFASGEAYEGRTDLGNTEPGDGKRYKGRGLIQLTGRANYRAFGEAVGIALEDEPERAAEPALSLVIACEYWRRRDINAHADRDDIIAATWAVNGGLNGLDDRRACLAKAKAELARHLFAPATALPVLRQGTRGPVVARLQHGLREAGITVGLDGDFGPGTKAAVITFQNQAGLVADGIVGAASWARLARNEPANA